MILYGNLSFYLNLQLHYLMKICHQQRTKHSRAVTDSCRTLYHIFSEKIALPKVKCKQGTNEYWYGYHFRFMHVPKGCWNNFRIEFEWCEVTLSKKSKKDSKNRCIAFTICCFRHVLIPLKLLRVKRTAIKKLVLLIQQHFPRWWLPAQLFIRRFHFFVWVSLHLKVCFELTLAAWICVWVRKTKHSGERRTRRCCNVKIVLTEK